MSSFIILHHIGNADSVRKIRDNTSERTIAWAVNGTDANNSTVTAVTLESGTEGLTRKETVVTINCDNDDVSLYAKHSAGECTVTEEIDASVNVKGMEHEVGDIVIVYDDLGGYNEMRINAIEKEYSGCKMRKNLFFVDYQAPVSRKKTLTKLAAASSTTQKDIIDQKLDSGSGGEEENDGLTIENAVIIQESDAKYLLHEYTQIEYIAGNKIGYAGTENQVIAQGMVIYKQDGAAPNGVALSLSQTYSFEIADYSFAEAEALAPNPNRYNSFNFAIPAYYYKNSENCYCIDSIGLEVSTVNTDNTYYTCYMIKDDGEKVSWYTFNNYYNWSEFGIFYQWKNIYPPGYTVGEHTFEFGCVNARTCFIRRDYNYRDSYYEFDILSSSSLIYIPFASLAEYNAAVGLTYEPLSLTQINETTTVV